MSSIKIGTHIREKREKLNVSQEAVAFALGISQAAYSKIERNETQIKVAQAYRIAEFLKISIYELLPASVASDLTGENIFGLIAHYSRVFVKKIIS